MSKSKIALLLALVLIIAGGLRLYHLKQLPPGLYPDEAMNGNNALEALNNGAFGGKVFYPENNGREGLFMNIQAGFLATTGLREPWVMRLPSALFGILTVLGMYFLGRELFSKRVGLLASFLLATSFWHINFSRIGFRAIMAPFFLVWALYFFLLALHRYLSDEKKTFSFFCAAIGGIVFGLGFYSYIAYRVSPLLFLLLVPFFLKNKGFWKLAATFVLFTILIALPIGIYYLKNPADFLGRTSQVSVMSSASPIKDLGLNILKTAAMFNFRGDGNWRHNFAGRPELFWPVGILLWIGIILAVRALWKKFRRGEDHGNAMPSVIIFGWLILAALPVVVSNEGIPHALRSILLIPPVILLAGWGGIFAYDKIQKLLSFSSSTLRLKKMFAAFAWVVLALLVLEAATTYFILWGKNPNVQGAFAADQVELGRKLEALPADIPKYVVVKAGGTDVRGYPMPTQTVMFITDTFRPEMQKVKNIYYVLPKDEGNIPAGALKFYIQ